jgi:hypothetical protein
MSVERKASMLLVTSISFPIQTRKDFVCICCKCSPELRADTQLIVSEKCAFVNRQLPIDKNLAKLILYYKRPQPRVGAPQHSAHNFQFSAAPRQQNFIRTVHPVHPSIVIQYFLMPKCQQHKQTNGYDVSTRRQ